MITDKERFEQFKRDLKSYRFKKKKLYILNQKIEKLSEKKYVDYDALEELQKKKEIIEGFIQDVDVVMSKIDLNIREALTDCYINERNHERVALDYFFGGKTQMYREFERELKGIL